MFVCTGIIVVCTLLGTQVGGVPRPRRSLAQLSSMVRDITGHEGSDFVSYGNWCGLGGSGKPLDPIDECCRIHDLCYDVSSKGACGDEGKKVAYKVEYDWKKGRDGAAHCDEESDRCKASVCRCDTGLADCLRDNSKSYDPKKLRKPSFYELMQEANWLYDA